MLSREDLAEIDRSRELATEAALEHMNVWAQRYQRDTHALLTERAELRRRLAELHSMNLRHFLCIYAELDPPERADLQGVIAELVNVVNANEGVPR